MSHSPHLITHGRRGLLHAGFGREIQRKTQNRQLAAFAFYSQTLSNDLARAGEQQGSAEVLLYQGRQVATDSTEVKSSNDFNKQISNSGYNGSTDQTMINTSQVDMTDSTQVVQALVHENARRDMARGGVGATLDATDQTTLASTRGQRGAETFTAYAELNGESTKGDSAKGAGTQSQWNAANANSETIKAGNAVVAKMNSKEVKPWLGDEQKVQMAKEMSAAKGVDKLAVLVKWGTTSVKQDALTTMGVGKGLKEAGINDIKGVVEFLKDPIKGLDGLAQLVNSPEMREKLGAEMLNSLNTRIESMKTALKQGGDQNAEQLGKDLGNLIWQAGSVVTTVGGVAAGGAKLAKMGVKLGDKTLESMKAASAAAKAEAAVANQVTREIAATTKPIAQYGPFTRQGPLPPAVASTFRGGTYVETVTAEPTVLYRVYGGTAKESGAYWTTTPPAGPVQSIIDSALLPQWGNTATQVIKAEIPPGVTLFQGKATSQGGLVGGGNQVIVPKNFNSSWIKK